MAGQTWRAESAAYLTPRSGKASDAWGEEAARQQKRGTQRLIEVAEVTPSDAIAEALRLHSDEPAVIRRRVMLLDDHPVELTDSYYAAWLARGTRLAERRKIPGGAVTLLAELGRRITDVSETVTVDIPSPETRHALELADDEPVLVLTRVSRTHDGSPVEVSVMTMPRGACLRYETKVG